MTAAPPDGAGRMDHVLSRQPVAFGDLRLPGLAAVQRPALLQQRRPGRPVDRAVHPAAAQQGGVGRVDDGVYSAGRDVPLDDLKRHGKLLSV